MFSTQQQQPQKFGTLLGSSTAPTGGLFNTSTQPQQRQSLFGGTLGSGGGGGGGGGTAAPTTSLFGGTQLGASQQQPQQQGASLFGGTMQSQPRPFGQQSQSTGLPPLRGSALGVSLEKPVGPRDKPILEQMGLLYQKWNPNDPNCAFQAYTYNAVGDNAIAYGPGPSEDPAKWEEALANKPDEKSVPLLLRGFEAIHTRIQIQTLSINQLSLTLHAINNSLTTAMQDHELKFQVRFNEARNRHNNFTQRVVRLAAKVQILRNRGYAIDPTEEELLKKLTDLQSKAYEPALTGRQEEIWARMSAARARAQILQAESDKLGQAAQSRDGSVLNEEEQKQVRKILEDYDSQLAHLKKEIDEIRKDYEEWEKAQKPATK